MFEEKKSIKKYLILKNFSLQYTEIASNKGSKTPLLFIGGLL